jgi:hypothetical protein
MIELIDQKNYKLKLKEDVYVDEKRVLYIAESSVKSRQGDEGQEGYCR